MYERAWEEDTLNLVKLLNDKIIWPRNVNSSISWNNNKKAHRYTKNSQKIKHILTTM